SNPSVSHRPDDLDSQRTAAYLGADRLLRTALLVLPEASLWPRSGALEWEEFVAALEASGPRGRAVVEVLRGGEEVQREALSDGDRDGLPQIAETLLGTRADRWD